MESVECENAHDDSSHKKGRHRKKQLYNSLLQQMEFYFSDSNLSKDRFLSQLIQENPFVDLSIFLKFNKIRKLSTSLDDIRKAVGKSEVLELSEDNQTIRRITPVKVKQNVDDCTIYVEKIKADATHEWVSSVFAEFGNVVYVSIPKYKHTKINKGFAFIEFETDKEAQIALQYFESIGCKMPSHLNPEELCSIATFEKDDAELSAESNLKTDKVIDLNTSKKRKRSAESNNENENEDQKKLKSDDESGTKDKETLGAVSESEDADGKKKKKLKKEHKKKNYIKEIGLQVLSKKEWKKMRNHYLDQQKKKMKEFKKHLYRMRFSQQNYNEKTKTPADNTGDEETMRKSEGNAAPKLEFTPGVIVKVKLSEPCSDAKKLKTEIKSASDSVKFVDISLSVSEEIFIRFGDSSGAAEFCKQEAFGQKHVLLGKEEKKYWEKLENDRQLKFKKGVKKQRGRDKLLKKAKQKLQHIRFEEDN